MRAQITFFSFYQGWWLWRSWCNTLAGGSRTLWWWGWSNSSLRGWWHSLSSTQSLIPFCCYGFPDKLQLFHRCRLRKHQVGLSLQSVARWYDTLLKLGQVQMTWYKINIFHQNIFIDYLLKSHLKETFYCSFDWQKLGGKSRVAYADGSVFFLIWIPVGRWHGNRSMAIHGTGLTSAQRNSGGFFSFLFFFTLEKQMRRL